MDEFPGLMARDFGFRAQGKSAPMSASKSSAAGGDGVPNMAGGSVRSSSPASSWNKSRSGWKGGDSLLGGGIPEDRSPPGYDDVFGDLPMYSNPSSHGRSASSSSSPPSFDSMFGGFKDTAPKSSSLPVYDKPIYDDDIFDGVPGIKSSSFVKYDDVFGSIASASHHHASSPPYDDLLQNLGKAMPEHKGTIDRRSGEQKDEGLSGFDELIPGFGGSSPRQREPSDTGQHSDAPSAEPAASMAEDPFVVLETTSSPAYSSSGLFTDPLEHIGRPPLNSGSSKVGASSISGGVFDDNNFDELTRSVPLFTSEMNDTPKDRSPLNTEKELPQRSSMETFESFIPKMQPTKSSDSLKYVGRSTVQNSDANVSTYERNVMEDQSPPSYEHLETADDVWLTVAEIPLFTQPISAPPPSRPPPPVSIKQAQYGNTDHFSYAGLKAKRTDNESFSQFSQNHPHMKNSGKKSGASPIDELEDFAVGKTQRYANEHAEVFTSEEEIETDTAAAASAAAMKEAMDRAEAKLKQAREVRERERDAKSSRSRECTKQETNERAMADAHDPYEREKQERLDHEREHMEKEEKEKEQKRREKEREQELGRERERARQAVERATREARERAAAEARIKAERAAVEKVNAETRQRAERAAVQRAAAEARERAAAEAKERAEKAAAEARERVAAERAAADARERVVAERAAEARERVAAERAASEARERVAAERAAAEARERSVAARDKAATEARERAAVERAAAEARLRAQRAAVDRATAEARERAATSAREKLHKAENDLESFFGMSARANSAPKQRTTNSESVFDAQFPSKGVSDGARRASPSSSSTIRKAPSATNIVDDLTSIFGAPPSSGDFQDVEGESEERRRARLERHQRTRERAAKALAEKNERDMQSQREQAERHRIAETLDVEIKRWAAGKEGNLRALLSTLQYVLWPECGWQPVSLTDLITGASVKKVYRKATLCIHPDKVQQKGASLQQKYIAEKVFDLLKESWNKFNSEELF